METPVKRSKKYEFEALMAMVDSGDSFSVAKLNKFIDWVVQEKDFGVWRNNKASYDVFMDFIYKYPNIPKKDQQSLVLMYGEFYIEEMRDHIDEIMEKWYNIFHNSFGKEDEESEKNIEKTFMQMKHLHHMAKFLNRLQDAKWDQEVPV